jgi:serine phosphatase RsbU (regulator of sigma subunit)/anti-sigma regulatory factor (Ser/Thr protein kinase)/anti-anti-sigma regulatory factor
MRHDGRVTGVERLPSGDPDLLASAIEQLPFILAVCEGPELRLVAFSAATSAVLPGRDPLGRPIRDVISDLSGQQFVDAYYQVYRTGEPISGQEWRAHLDMPDGSVHEMWATFTISPWRHPDGSLRGVIGAGFDVTESVRARAGAEEQAAGLRARYEQSRDVITALQQELLPPGLPVLPGVQVAASYLLAEAGTAAGGDWYDAVVQPDGKLALIVGDVVGHGVTASGVMGQLRAVLQDRLDAGGGIAEALAAADRFARRLPAAHATTVCLAIFDPADGTIAYCTAGHPPPLVITAAGRTRFLPGTGATPLGTGGTFPIRDDRLGIGDMLLLYSDGILERPGRAIPGSADELARVAADSAAGRALRDPDATPAERVCTQTVELLVRSTGHTDDITLLAAQRVEPPPALDLQLPAVPASLRVSRVTIGAWLERLGATEDDTFLLQHALGELLTNAIEHGSASGGAADAPMVALHALLGPNGCLRARITDQGRWREPARQSVRGRGLALTSQLVDDVRVEPTGAGTIATLHHSLSRPSRMLTGELPGVARPVAADPEFRICDGPGSDESLVLVEGPLDADTAERLRQNLLHRGRGGTLPLTVDLAGVTHLASAGVSALHRVAEKHGQQGGKLTLRTAAGSPAQQILVLVAIPNVTLATG